MDIHQKLGRDFLKIIEKLHRYRIARVDSHIHPDFEYSKKPTYASICVSSTHPKILRNLVDYLQEQVRNIPNHCTLKLEERENNQYEIIIYHNPKHTPQHQWIEELEDLLKRVPPIIDNYQMKHRTH